MTRVYISGPITGIPNLNRDAFDHEERLLREVGDEVFNPHSLTPPDDNTFYEWEAEYHSWEALPPEVRVSSFPSAQERLWRYYMRICVAQIPLCDEIRMLPHWQNSKGAVWEHRIAMMLGLKVTYCPVVEVPKW